MWAAMCGGQVHPVTLTLTLTLTLNLNPNLEAGAVDGGCHVHPVRSVRLRDQIPAVVGAQLVRVGARVRDKARVGARIGLGLGV